MVANNLRIIDQNNQPNDVASPARQKGMALVDASGIISAVYGGFDYFFAMQPNQIVGKNLLKLLAAPELQNVFEQLQGEQKLQQLNGIIATIVAGQNSGQSCEVSLLPQSARCKNAPAYVVELAECETLQTEHNSASIKHDDRIKFALQSAAQAAWDCDMNTGQVWYSSRWYTMRGFEIGDPKAPGFESWKARLHPDDRDAILERVHAQDSGELAENAFEYRERHADGNWIWVMSRGRIIAWNSDGTPARIVGTDTDITDMKLREQQQALDARRFFEKSIDKIAAAHEEVVKDREREKERADKDPLTGLANRSVLIETLDSWKDTDQVQNETQLLFFLDLDDFKPINDDLGHLSGDHVLQVIAKRLKQATKEGDVVARLGGDEFALLIRRQTCSNESKNEIVHRIASRIIKAIVDPIAFEENRLSIGVSVGIADIGSKSISTQETLKRADLAMYEAKKLGGNRYSIAAD